MCCHVAASAMFIVSTFCLFSEYAFKKLKSQQLPASAYEVSSEHVLLHTKIYCFNLHYCVSQDKMKNVQHKKCDNFYYMYVIPVSVNMRTTSTD